MQDFTLVVEVILPWQCSENVVMKVMMTSQVKEPYLTTEMREIQSLVNLFSSLKF